MGDKKIFSIVVPVYQNDANLDDTIPKLLSLQDRLPDYNLELVLVDDGSTDNSYNLLIKYYNLHIDKIKIVKLTKNFGQIPAIQAGLKAASGDCAGIISADLQDPYELFIDMIRKWENGIKLIIGERENREEAIRQNFISMLYWKMVNKYAVKDYPLGGFDFCLIDKQIMKDINEINEKNTHIFALIFSLGYKYEIIPYTRKKRVAGKSQWTFPKKIKLLTDTFIAFSYLPIRGISYLGLGISALSFLYALVIAVSKFIFGNKYEGWTTIVVLVSFFSGLILLTLGIIGEYLWRILDEVRKRPNYVIDKILENTQDTKK